ncbi:MAG: hypothetical protein KA215_04150 [Flavobacterium sp.]|mgnify:CR=1 FL=1|nr:hypothetical protein [Flavobacterium sp.]
MRLSTTILALTFVATLFTSCSSDDSSDGEVTPTPTPGTTRVITQDIEYHSGLIEETTSWATWPVAIFPVDSFAVSYRVKVLKTGKIYAWNSDQPAASEFPVFPSQNDIVNGKFYIGLDRTWCAGCTEVDPLWQQFYVNFYGTENKVEITFFY